MRFSPMLIVLLLMGCAINPLDVSPSVKPVAKLCSSQLPEANSLDFASDSTLASVDLPRFGGRFSKSFSLA